MPEAETGPACRQCRARKVRCDRVEPSCGACSRLGFRCSYFGASDAPVTEDEQIEQGQGQGHSPSASSSSSRALFTQAGTKRRRTLHACQQCRLQKVKCSGSDRGPTSSCERCQARGCHCVWTTTIDDVDRERGEPGPVAVAPYFPTPKTTMIGGTLGMGVSQERESDFLVDKTTARRYIDTYFSKTNPMTCIFLHRPSVLAAWSKDELDPLLLQALCASGLRLMTNSYGSSSEREVIETTARAWIHEVQTVLLLRHMGRHSLVQLQALVLVVLFHFHAGEAAQAWDLVALAARSAFALHLNHEQPELESAAQESRRRLLWTIYILDRLFSGGIEDLAICPGERIHIRLPCDDPSFQRGISSRAEYLESGSVGGDDASQSGELYGTDVLAYYIRLSAIRDKILRYTKGVRRSGTSPIASRDRLEALQRELQILQDRLPDDLRLSPDQLLLKAHSTDRNGYILLHILWFQCHCDLYRFLIPGIRESVSEAAMSATPPEFIDACQRACLSNAIQLCELWSATHVTMRNLSEEAIDDLFLPVSIYQVAQILHHLHHLLPPSPDRHCLDRLSARLGDALEMAWAMPNMPARAVSCLRDVERVLRLLGQGGDRGDDRGSPPNPQFTSTVPVRVEPFTGKDDDDGQQATHDMDHLPSRHSFIPCASEESGELGANGDRAGDSGCLPTWGDNNINLRRTTVELVPPNLPPLAQVAHATTNHALLPLPQNPVHGPDTPFPGLSVPGPPPLNSVSTLAHQGATAAHDGSQTPGSLWDPFDMELNGYYGLGLGQLFA